MMRIAERIKFWKKLAQTTAENQDVIVGNAPTITLSQIPTFKTNLFSVKPEFTQDLQLVINILNKYLFSLSAGKLDFSATWKNPSIGPSQYTNSLKNIFSLSKWIYNIVSSNEPSYSIGGLRSIAKQLNDTVVNMDFPDPKASTFKSEIISISQILKNKLQ